MKFRSLPFCVSRFSLAALLGAGLALAAPLVARAAIPADHWNTPHAANPILPGYFADPSLVQHDGKAYLYATLDPWGGRSLGCWESSDFKHWTFHELNWPTKEACTSATSSGAMVWAPSVVRSPNGRFFMYISVGSEVWVGSADHPLGPWSDAHHSRPLIPHDYRPGFHMIDAEAFIDDDGTAYLYWGSGWNWKNGKCFAVKLQPDMVTFDGEPRDVTPANYFEAPLMFKHGGRYHLSYSQGITIKDTYAVHYAVGDTPFGPFEEAITSPILTTDHARHVVSPGHHTLFRRDGRIFILYHRHSVPYLPDQAFRQICIDELRFARDGLIEKVVPTHAGPEFVQGRARARLATIATASSTLDESLYPASRVSDDNYATRWTAARDNNGSWLQLDLGRVQPIARNELRFEYAWKTYRFALEISRDGDTWQPLVDHRAAGVSGSPVTITVPAEGRFLRLNFPAKSESETPSLFEWAVY